MQNCLRLPESMETPAGQAAGTGDPGNRFL